MSRLSGAQWWACVGLILGLPTLLAHDATWALHPSQGLHQNPLNFWTCAWVHANARHLLVNLGALSLMIVLGWACQLPGTGALAWFLAWPLTHLALLLDPRLDHYFGMSGVLHAGIAVIAVHLIVQPRQPHPPGRISGPLIGWAVLGGVLLKCALENPTLKPLVFRSDLAMNVAPLSHLAGTLVGALVATALLNRHRRAQSPP
ncbi:MAG: rhomboid family intramembrane serine protease [Burkholderiales bacterium]|nr:rhomboid family intramembrane serine protease [Burkholderiales bacterium]